MSQVHQIKLDDDRLAQIARGLNPEGFEPSCMAIELQEYRKQGRLAAEDLETSELVNELHSRADRLVVLGEIDQKEARVYKGTLIELRGMVAELDTWFRVESIRAYEASHGQTKDRPAEPSTSQGDGTSVQVSPG